MKIDSIKSMSFSPIPDRTSGLLIITHRNGSIREYNDVEPGYYKYLKEVWINGSSRTVNNIVKVDKKKNNKPLAIKKLVPIFEEIS